MPELEPPPKRALQPVPETFRRTGRYWYFVDNITREEGKQPSIRLWMALPQNRPGQKATIGQIVPEPIEILKDKATGNQVVFWQIKDLPEDGGSLVFSVDFEVENHAVTFSIDPAKVQRVDKSSEEYRLFTASAPWVEITPELAAEAKKIVGAETNPFLQAGLVYDWVLENMTYHYPDVHSRGVKAAFAQLKGDCGEFSHVFIAMMRSLGIPARSVVANWYQGSGHAWAEILLPPYGWVPVDTSGAQLVSTGLKGQMDETQIKKFMETRGIPSRDPRYLLGNLYPHRLEVFVGDYVTFTSKVPEGTRSFHFLQPGGSTGWPPAILLDGLSKKTVHGGFFFFGKKSRDRKAAEQRAQQTLAAAYLAAGLPEKAVVGLEKTLELKPDNATTQFLLGQTYFHLRRYNDAITFLQHSLAGKGGSTKASTDVWALILTGMCYDALGERDDAVTAYQKAIDSGVDFNGSLKTAKKFVATPFKHESKQAQ